MDTFTRRRCLGWLGASALAAGVGAAGAADERPLTLRVPFTAGGTTDRHLRLLAELVAERQHRTVRVENHTGAGGTAAAASLVADGAEPDGHTLAVYPMGMLRVPLMTSVPWDPIQDFSFVICLADYTFSVVVRGDSRWQTLKAMLAQARLEPNSVSVASAGVGSSPHIAIAMLAEASGTELLHVPFRGEVEQEMALLGGHVSASVETGSAAPHVRAGRMRMLALLTQRRSPRWPGVPTARELGYDVSVSAPYGLVGPRGMAPEQVQRLHDAFRDAMRHPRHLELLDRLEQEPFYLDAGRYRRWAVARFAEERQLLQRLGLLGR